MSRELAAANEGSQPRVRLKSAIRGAVQGVGFRPFVFRLATELGLTGWVNNSAQGVFIEVEGRKPILEQFLLRLEAEKPPLSFIQSLESSWLDPVGYPQFEIRPSDEGGARTASVLPDIATCPDCRREIFDPADRRYFYPFTNCTNCGPRFSIIQALPYDRAHTSMRTFTMCGRCQAEYDDPRDRRFHAQPNACPVCGPHLELWNRAGPVESSSNPYPDRPAQQAVSGASAHDVLLAAAVAIRAGKILAVKGLGGFHLLVAAHEEAAVRRLRDRKHREEKPFAVMFPALSAVRAVCEVSRQEERLLRSPEAPIVLLHRAPAGSVSAKTGPSSGHPALAASIAPGNPNLGVLLPYTPLHHLLLALLEFPVVATSGNLSDEPICTDEAEARERLGGLADLFLVHNRPIVRHVDDSVVRMVAGREMVLRRARGYAPLPLQLRASPLSGGAPYAAPTVLAVGAHLKNTTALAIGPQVFLSQHIGDLETEPAYDAFCRVIEDFQQLYEARPALVAADLHPDYLSTRFARDHAEPAAPGKTDAPGPRLIGVQHHIAHVLACLAENELAPPVLGVSWDGTGYGLDGTVWGGEFFRVASACERIAHWRQFRLPGGEQAIREPRRAALGLLYELFGDALSARNELAPVRACSPAELGAIQTMLARQLNAPPTTSAGRLFDAVASLAGLRQQVRFEGQAAMELEFALGNVATQEAYPVAILSPATAAGSLVLDWGPLIAALLADLDRKPDLAAVSARFHNALVEGLLAVARHAGEERVVLSGGCFQNRYLTERAVARLRDEGFRPYWHQRVPPNDGGIALGQVVAARWMAAPEAAPAPQPSRPSAPASPREKKSGR